MYAISDLKVAEVIQLYRDGLSVRAVAAAAGVATHTAQRYRPEGLVCPCGKAAGHSEWCAFRISLSPSRQAYLERCRVKTAQRLAIVRSRRELFLTTWPYIRSFDNDDYALLKAVNDLVPRGLPEAVRADVCQEIIVDVIAGEISIEEIPKLLR